MLYTRTLPNAALPTPRTDVLMSFRVILFLFSVCLLFSPPSAFTEENLPQAVDGSLLSFLAAAPEGYFPGASKEAAQLAESGDCEKARGVIARTMRASSRLAGKEKYYLIAAMCALSNGDIATARKSIDRALTVRRGSSDTLYLLGRTLAAQSDYQAASSAYAEALWFERHQLVPRAVILLEYARALLQLKQHEKAREFLVKAGTQGAPDIEAALLLAQMGIEDEDKDFALKWARTAYERAPEDYRTRTALARTLLYGVDRALNAADIEEAVKLSRAAVEQRTEDAAALQSALPVLIRALLAQGEVSEASSLTQKARKQFPGNQEFARLAQQVVLEKEAFKKALELTPTPASIRGSVGGANTPAVTPNSPQAPPPERVE